jgi:hypothetical protein
MAWSYERFALADERLFKNVDLDRLDPVISGPFSELVCVCSSPLGAASAGAAKGVILRLIS